MENKTKELLRNEFERELASIDGLPVGDEYIGGAVSDLATLGKLLVDMEKVDIESEKEKERQALEREKFERELENQERQNNVQKKNQWVRIGVEVASGVALPIITLVVYNEWKNQGFEFEKEGTICSQTFRNVFGKFRLFKK